MESGPNGTHTFHFNCFFEDFNCVFTQIRCLSRVLIYSPVIFLGEDNPVILLGEDNGIIYIGTTDFVKLMCHAREVFPRRGFSSGASIAEKWGFWGKCLK